MPLSTRRIEHVIHNMLENRSFDNILGWLYNAKNPPKNIKLISNDAQEDVAFYGLAEGKYSEPYPGDYTEYLSTRPAGRGDFPIPDLEKHVAQIEDLFTIIVDTEESKNFRHLFTSNLCGWVYLKS